MSSSLFNNKKTFKETNTLHERITESNRIRAKYPTHIPVIINWDSKLGSINKHKFLVPSDVSASHLLFSVKKQILPQEVNRKRGGSKIHKKNGGPLSSIFMLAAREYIFASGGKISCRFFYANLISHIQ